MILDDRSYIKKIDKSGMLNLIENFDRQCAEAGSIEVLPLEKKQYDCVVFSGMGGSAIAGDILKKLVENNTSIPFFVHRDYGLPNFVGKNSLILAVSYSGNTEETLSAYRQGVARGCSVWALSSGGELEKLATTDGIPHVKIPSGYPPAVVLVIFFSRLKNFYILLEL